MNKISNIATKNFNKKCFSALTLSNSDLKLNSIQRDGSMSVPLTQLNINQSTEESSTKLTKLSNGLRIITDSNNQGAGRIGFMADVGYSDEDSSWSSGINNLLNVLQLKQSKDRNTMQARRILQWTGGSVKRSVDRDTTTQVGNCLQEHVPSVFAVMADSLLEHKATFDLLEGHSSVRNAWTAGEQSMDHMDLTDRAFMTAFGQCGQGNQKQGAQGMLESLCEEELDLWQDVMFSPNKMVVSGQGVEHDSFVELVDKYLGDRMNVDDHNALGNRFAPRLIKQKGGDARVHLPASGSTALLLAFPSTGYTIDNLAVCTVLQVLLGEATVFSTGGPGKGMHSLLNRVMQQTGFLTEAKAVNIAHKNVGLFGIQASSINNQQAEHTLEVLTRVLCDLAEGVNDADLARAKNLTKVNVAMGHERSSIRMEESLRNILHQDELKNLEYFQMIDQVDKTAISNFVKMLLSSPPTLCVKGNASSVPSYDKVSNYFESFKTSKQISSTNQFLSE